MSKEMNDFIQKLYGPSYLEHGFVMDDDELEHSILGKIKGALQPYKKERSGIGPAGRLGSFSGNMRKKADQECKAYADKMFKAGNWAEIHVSYHLNATDTQPAFDVEYAFTMESNSNTISKRLVKNNPILTAKKKK